MLRSGQTVVYSTINDHRNPSMKHLAPYHFDLEINVDDHHHAWLVGGLLFAAILICGGIISFLLIYQSKIYPNTTIENVDVSSLSKEAALQKIEKEFKLDSNHQITLQHADTEIATKAGSLNLDYDYQRAVNMAFNHGHSKNIVTKATDLLTTPFKKNNHQLVTTVDTAAVEKLITSFAKQIAVPGSKPTATLQTSGAPASLEIENGSYGLEVDTEKGVQQLINELTFSASETLSFPYSFEVPTNQTGLELSEEELAAARERAAVFVDQQLEFIAADLTHYMSDQQLITALQFPADFNNQEINSIVSEWQEATNRDPVEPIFEYDPETLEVSSFTPPRAGLSLDAETARNEVATALEQVENDLLSSQQSTEEAAPPEITNSFPLTVATTEPETALAETNDLGIVEIIGSGDSQYHHSIPSRVHNVSLTAERTNYEIVKPGEEYSFNESVGEISSRTGYRPAYVIRNGQTELGDGGGVCQVSTTVFRAALDAGLDITRRLQHSYRVSYYELNAKPGIDATVYSGDIDLRFRNDTDHHILVYNQVDEDDRYMKTEIYGTSDGRSTEIIDHRVWDFRPPPPPQYSTDPSLPSGAVRQVDWAVSGVRAEFTNVIKDESGDVIREDTYTSNYRPWSAKYLVGE